MNEHLSRYPYFQEIDDMGALRQEFHWNFTGRLEVYSLYFQGLICWGMVGMVIYIPLAVQKAHPHQQMPWWYLSFSWGLAALVALCLIWVFHKAPKGYPRAFALFERGFAVTYLAGNGRKVFWDDILDMKENVSAVCPSGCVGCRFGIHTR